MERTGSNVNHFGSPLPKDQWAAPNGLATGGKPHPKISEEALSQCLKMVRFSLTHDMGPNRERAIAAIDRALSLDPSDADETHIASLQLSQRLQNQLERHGVHSVEELLALSEDQLREIPGFGDAAIQEVRNALNNVGKRGT